MNTFFVTMLDQVPQKTFTNLKAAKSAANQVPEMIILEFLFSEDKTSFFFVAIKQYCRLGPGSSCWTTLQTKGIKYRPQF